MQSELRLITAATTTTVTFADAKDHLYVTADDYNTTILAKLKAATEFCQRRIPGHRQFMAATYDLYLDEFPDDEDDDRITLPLPPAKSVSWVKYYNSSGTLTTLGSTNGSTASTTSYTFVQPTDAPGFLVPAFGTSWPSSRDVPNAVTVRFVAGYSTQASVPETIKQAVLLKLEQLWDPGRFANQDEIDTAIDRLLACNHYGHYA